MMANTVVAPATAVRPAEWGPTKTTILAQGWPRPEGGSWGVGGRVVPPRLLQEHPGAPDAGGAERVQERRQHGVHLLEERRQRRHVLLRRVQALLAERLLI